MPPNLPYGYVYGDTTPSQAQTVPSRPAGAVDPLFQSPNTDSDSGESSSAPMKKAKREPRPSTTRTPRGLFFSTPPHAKHAANKEKHVSDTETEQDTFVKGAKAKSQPKAPAMPFGVNGGINVTPTPSTTTHKKGETTSELEERFASLKRNQPLKDVCSKAKSVAKDSKPVAQDAEPVSSKARSSSASGLRLNLKGPVAKDVRKRSMSAGPMRPEADVRRVARTREITREIKIYTSGELWQAHKKGMARGFIVHIPCFDFKDPSTKCYCGHPGEHEYILQGIVHDRKFMRWIKLAKQQVMEALEAEQHLEPNFSIICICKKGRHRWPQFCKSVS